MAQWAGHKVRQLKTTWNSNSKASQNSLLASVGTYTHVAHTHIYKNKINLFV